MGSASSKAVRKLPKHPDPSWSASRATAPSKSSKSLKQSPIAEERRTRDSGDPHFLANLNKLGPVKVDHHMQSVQPAQKTREMLESRLQSEREAFSMQPSESSNRVQAPTLCFLLDKRKSTASKRDIQDLASKYGLKVEKLESVARYVSSPSIQSGSIVKTVGQDGEEKVSVTAVWIEPSFSK
ncbi:hypothetical protein K435DRAFT_499211 [Dendrothele bispora CBS 962.96]|uniref:Uncharacterized protein n=1 Tax=Dendrothele bispora (strain CBS 962.96) TaxID=1314807 RepID=A0A4S8MA67_DENBC|nr:hypothetical protein K435DRAFT_499211 [Dendrothele bispora CBS 962.96]